MYKPWSAYRDRWVIAALFRVQNFIVDRWSFDVKERKTVFLFLTIIERKWQLFRCACAFVMPRSFRTDFYIIWYVLVELCVNSQHNRTISRMGSRIWNFQWRIHQINITESILKHGMLDYHNISSIHCLVALVRFRIICWRLLTL